MLIIFTHKLIHACNHQAFLVLTPTCNRYSDYVLSIKLMFQNASVTVKVYYLACVRTHA